jgi:hypothetical protein
MAIAPTSSLRFEPVPERKKTITIGHIVINDVRLKVTLENVPNKHLTEAELKETLEKAHLIAATILGEPDQLRDLKKLTVNNSGYNLNGKQHDEEKEILAKDVYTQKFKDSFYEINEKKQFERNYSFYESYTQKDLYQLKEQQTVKISHLYQSIIQKFYEEPFIDESEIKKKKDDSSSFTIPISEPEKPVSGASLGLRFNASLKEPVVKPDHPERDGRESSEIDVLEEVIDELEEASKGLSVSKSIKDSDPMIKMPQSRGQLNARAVPPKGPDGNLNRKLDSDEAEYFDADDVQPNRSRSSSNIGIDDPDFQVVESDNKPGIDSFVEVTSSATTPSGRSRSSSLVGNLYDLELDPKYDGEVEKLKKAASSIPGASSKSGFLKTAFLKMAHLVSKPKLPLTAEEKDKQDNRMEVEVSG